MDGTDIRKTERIHPQITQITQIEEKTGRENKPQIFADIQNEQWGFDSGLMSVKICVICGKNSSSSPRNTASRRKDSFVAEIKVVRRGL